MLALVATVLCIKHYLLRGKVSDNIIEKKVTKLHKENYYKFNYQEAINMYFIFLYCDTKINLCDKNTKILMLIKGIHILFTFENENDYTVTAFICRLF